MPRRNGAWTDEATAICYALENLPSDNSLNRLRGKLWSSVLGSTHHTSTCQCSEDRIQIDEAFQSEGIGLLHSSSSGEGARHLVDVAPLEGVVTRPRTF